ncbi:MAG: FHA domain-containing protein [Planctomycetota bacterium]
MVQLKIIDHTGQVRIHELVDDMTTVGRASTNTIQVVDEKASRQHFRIEKAAERFRLVDLKSTNGTRLNGVKLQGEVLLRPGDKITLGGTNFLFDEANAPKDQPAAPAVPAQPAPPPPPAQPVSLTAPTIMSTPGGAPAAAPPAEASAAPPPAASAAPPPPAASAAPAPSAASAAPAPPTAPAAPPPAPAPAAPAAAPEPPAAPAAAAAAAAAVPAEAPKAAEPTAPKYILKVLEGINSGQVYELGTKPLTIGRHSSNTIQMVDDAVSNYHAEIAKEPIGYVVTDLGSTNGTRIKAKQKPEFEKIVKTPLSVGMQVRVGKTTLEFQNIGKPVEDEAFYGTVTLEPEKLAAKLAEPRRRVPMPALVAVAALVFLGVVFGVVKGIPVLMAALGKPGTEAPGKKKEEPKPVDLSNKITNGDFSQGTDDEGNPKDFRIIRGAPGVRAEIVPEADAGKDDVKLGLRINKAGKDPAALTAVETAATFAVEAGKVYEFRGMMRNDGEGLFGLRISWIQGERKFSENVVVLKGSQEWKDKKANLTPPAWAQRAKAGVFVQGNDGKACFDDLVFREEPGAAPVVAPPVKFGSVSVAFEGTKGMFTGVLQGGLVIEGGDLVLVSPDGASVSGLGSAAEPQMKAEANAVSFEGKIYDFALMDLTNYRIEARQGGQGVELIAAVDTPQAGASTPQLRFYITGNISQGDIEAPKAGGGGVEQIPLAEGAKSLTGIEELLFNASKPLQLDLLFAKPTDVELKREGKRCAVTISLKGEMQVALGPESVGQKRAMLAGLNEIQKCLESSRFGEAEVKQKAFRDAYAARFPQAREECGKLQGQIDNEWTKMDKEVRKAVDVVAQLKTPEAADAAKKTIERYQKQWEGSSRLGWVPETLAKIDAYVAIAVVDKDEKEAEKLYRNAEKFIATKVYNVALSLMKKILDDYPKTKTAEKVKEQMPKVEAEKRRMEYLNNLQDRLRNKTKNYLLANDFKGAINAIEKDPEYQENKKDLNEINELLDQWKKRAQP